MTTTYSFKEIWYRIYNKLLEIKNVRVWEVYNHDIKIENGISLPAIIITPSNWSIWFLDSCLNEHNLNYTVRIIDRIQNWYENVEDNMRELADIVLSKLQEIWTINWNSNDGYTVNVEFNYQWWFADTQEPFRVFEIECSFRCVQK